MNMDILLLIGAMMEETLTPAEKRARDKLAAALMSDTAKQLEREFREAQARSTEKEARKQRTARTSVRRNKLASDVLAALEKQ